MTASATGVRDVSGEREVELRANLRSVNEQIAEAARAAGVRSRDIGLVVVTKTWPAADAIALARLGVKAVAENRAQELIAKRRDVGGRRHEAALQWHFVGRLQTNKAFAVARVADLIESVDREDVIAALAKGAERLARDVRCLLQVSLDWTPSSVRSGVPPEQALALADLIGITPRLRLAGVMGIAPHGTDPRPAFDRLVEIGAAVRAHHPGARIVSAGMSHDFVAAIHAGATQVRIGTAVLGDRGRLR